MQHLTVWRSEIHGQVHINIMSLYRNKAKGCVYRIKIHAPIDTYSENQANKNSSLLKRDGEVQYWPAWPLAALLPAASLHVDM